MNIFGVGGTEFVLIILIMLIVAGPKRMVRWSYILGQYVGKFRNMWAEVVDVVQSEFDEAGLDVQLPKTPPTRGDLNNMANSAMRPFTQPMEEAIKEVEDAGREASFRPSMSGGSVPKKTPKPEPQAEAASQNGTTTTVPASNGSRFGTWGGATADDKPANTKTTTDGQQGFGTWSGAAQAEPDDKPDSEDGK